MLIGVIGIIVLVGLFVWEHRVAKLPDMPKTLSFIGWRPKK